MAYSGGVLAGGSSPGADPVIPPPSDWPKDPNKWPEGLADAVQQPGFWYLCEYIWEGADLCEMIRGLIVSLTAYADSKMKESNSGQTDSRQGVGMLLSYLDIGGEDYLRLGHSRIGKGRFKSLDESGNAAYAYGIADGLSGVLRALGC